MFKRFLNWRFQNRLKTYLFDLGNSKDEVAQNLQAQGIKGQVLKANRCPIANYLKRMEPDTEFRVGAKRIEYANTDRAGQMPLDGALRHITEFVIGFDQSEFGVLEENTV